MALIVHQTSVLDNWPVNPANTTAIVAGSLVGFGTAGDDAGKVVLANGTIKALGIAGDTQRTDAGSTTAYSEEVIISGGGKRFTQNRVDNYFNETAASGLMTVYTVGGVFSTDQYVANAGLVNGAPLTVGSGGDAGKFKLQTNETIVGYVTVAPGKYPSGVVGTDVQGSMSLGNYLTVLLAI